MLELEESSDLDSEWLAAFTALADADASRVAFHEADTGRVGVAAMRQTIPLAQIRASTYT